jgi:predicted DNA binding CopG/RHH family protein
VNIHEFIWTQDRIDHIAGHRVRPEEVEEVCFGDAWVRRAKATGRNPVYYILFSDKPDLDGTFLCCHQVSEWQRGTSDGSSHDGKRKTTIQPMERTMKAQKIPRTGSIQKLARFWDTHDLTDFEDQLEDISDPVFERKRETVIQVRLRQREVEAVKRVAKTRGVREAVLLRQWVREKLQDAKS